MYTDCFKICNKNQLEKSATLLEAAARKLQLGVVGFPTETTYALGAPLLNPMAVSRLYELKNRSGESKPLPVLANLNQVEYLVSDLPQEAQCLIQTFLPGPLSIILKKGKNISDLVSGNRETVAIRVPSDPIAQKLIELVGSPLVATSANVTGMPSATQAMHVLKDFNGLIEAIVDGGESLYGFESTIISLENPSCPTLIRFGVISQKSLEKALNKTISIHPNALSLRERNSFKKMRTVVRLFSSWEEIKLYLRLSKKSRRLLLSEERGDFSDTTYFPLSSRSLYEGLRKADDDGYSEVLVLCSHNIKRKAFFYHRLRQIAYT